jgi:hypothetical protein
MAVAAAVTAVPSAQQKENPDAAVELELYQMVCPSFRVSLTNLFFL